MLRFIGIFLLICSPIWAQPSEKSTLFSKILKDQKLTEKEIRFLKVQMNALISTAAEKKEVSYGAQEILYYATYYAFVNRPAEKELKLKEFWTKAAALSRTPDAARAGADFTEAFKKAKPGNHLIFAANYQYSLIKDIPSRGLLGIKTFRCKQLVTYGTSADADACLKELSDNIKPNDPTYKDLLELQFTYYYYSHNYKPAVAPCAELLKTQQSLKRLNYWKILCSRLDFHQNQFADAEAKISDVLIDGEDPALPLSLQLYRIELKSAKGEVAAAASDLDKLAHENIEEKATIRYFTRSAFVYFQNNNFPKTLEMLRKSDDESQLFTQTVQRHYNIVLVKTLSKVKVTLKDKELFQKHQSLIEALKITDEHLKRLVTAGLALADKKGLSKESTANLEWISQNSPQNSVLRSATLEYLKRKKTPPKKAAP